MEYEFWKAVAQSGSNDPDSGIYYFTYDGSTTDTHINFKGPRGLSKTAISWMNAAPDANGGPAPASHTQSGLKGAVLPVTYCPAGVFATTRERSKRFLF